MRPLSDLSGDEEGTEVEGGGVSLLLTPLHSTWVQLFLFLDAKHEMTAVPVPVPVPGKLKSTFFGHGNDWLASEASRGGVRIEEYGGVSFKKTLD
jgi:hypothetical protein